jgi:hypothetical protein
MQNVGRCQLAKEEHNMGLHFPVRALINLKGQAVNISTLLKIHTG